MIMNDDLELIKKIRQDPWRIIDVDNPSLNLQLLAVSNNGYVIKNISNPCDLVVWAAICNISEAICHIDSPSEEMCHYAVTKKPTNIWYIKEPSEKTLLIAARSDPFVLKYISPDFISYDVAKEVYLSNPRAALFIHHGRDSIDNF